MRVRRGLGDIFPKRCVASYFPETVITVHYGATGEWVFQTDDNHSYAKCTYLVEFMVFCRHFILLSVLSSGKRLEWNLLASGLASYFITLKHFDNSQRRQRFAKRSMDSLIPLYIIFSNKCQLCWSLVENACISKCLTFERDGWWCCACTMWSVKNMKLWWQHRAFMLGLVTFLNVCTETMTIYITYEYTFIYSVRDSLIEVINVFLESPLATKGWKKMSRFLYGRLWHNIDGIALDGGERISQRLTKK